jgi:hypothetical protein
MKINNTKFPFLRFLEKNRLNIDNSVYSEMVGYEVGIKDSENVLKLIKDKIVSIHYITKPIHDKLKNTDNFIKAKKLLVKLPEMTGLILLPEPLIPEITDPEVQWRPQDLKMNCILFSIVKLATYDKVMYDKDNTPLRSDFADDDEESYLWELDQYVNARKLHILPIQLDKFFHIHYDSLSSFDEEYGTPYTEYGRDINGNIIDYIWSFALFYNYTETDNKIVYGTDTEKARRVKVNDEKMLNETLNNIEIIDSTYFTKLIHTGEFGVTGHFKVQHYGSGYSESKIIYVNEYKKNGYTREAKITAKKNSGSQH